MSKYAETVEYAREVSNYFVRQDEWYRIKSNHNIKDIKYTTPDPYERFYRRLGRAFSGFFEMVLNLDTWGNALLGVRGKSLRHRLRYAWRVFKITLERDQNTPEMVVNDTMICFWSEDAIYLVVSQPRVFNLVLDWIEAEPNNPHAQKIVAEITEAVKRADNEQSESREETP